MLTPVTDSTARRRVLTFSEECDFSATPQRVYNIMIYPDTLPDLDHDFVQSWQPEELPPRVGTLNRMKLKAFGVPLFIKFTSRFAEHDPPHRFVIEVVRPSFATGTRWMVDLEEIPGGTHGMTTVEFYTAGWATPLAYIGRLLMRRSVRTGIRSLQARLGSSR